VSDKDENGKIARLERLNEELKESLRRSREGDGDEVARLEQINDDLKRSLRRCRDMLHDYEIRLTANSNEPVAPADEQESGEG